MDLRFEGRRVLVVGASAGIGLATARMLAAEGAGVAMASRSESAIVAAAEAIGREAGTAPVALAADITFAGEAERLVSATTERLGGLDAVIDCVGGSIRSAFEKLSDEDWLGNYSFNVLSAVRLVRAALPALRQGKDPAIVILGAASARQPHAHQVVSNVHKAGLLGLVKTLAGELAPEGIRVNSVAPGRTLTRLWTDRADHRRVREGDPARPLRRSGRGGGDGRVARLAARRLRHRPDGQRGRRHRQGPALSVHPAYGTGSPPEKNRQNGSWTSSGRCSAG
jgi:3-oxoacyl-[acyl-carrier protein] reductase